MFDGVFQYRPGNLIAQAARNRYLLLLDRATGEHLLPSPLVESLNWSEGTNAKGQPIPDSAEEPQVDGALVSPSSGAVNWSSPSHSPDSGLFYVSTTASFSIYYKTDTDPHPEGYGGRDSGLGIPRVSLRAIDYRTGRHPGPTIGRVLETVWSDWLYGIPLDCGQLAIYQRPQR